jgi:predicted TIM-barrel fold metal-dependent hydrolase
MERVQKAYPAGVLPFLAVDPRRDNVLELFQRVFAEPTRFFGIKIYPSLGYFPSDPTLLKVFEICEEKNIPVTAHCSGGTVRSSYKTIKAGRLVKLERDERFTTEKRWIKRWDFTPVVMRNADDFAETFNHPRNWEPVLKLFPKLRLNLAHFGGGEQWLDEGAEKNNDWIKTIVEFLENPDYPNVYTDISYTFAVSPAGGWMVGAFYGDKGDLLRDKCLYGSDWYMTMIEGKFKNHLDTFISGVGREAFDRISRDNPRKFLGLDRTDY